MKYFLVTTALICRGVLALAQSADLTTQIRLADSLLFSAGYNRCDTMVFEDMLCTDFEFWHDQSGITSGKRLFIASVRDGLCQLPYRARRVSIDTSITVYPMYRNNEIYAAVQHGEHHFYALFSGKAPVRTSAARYTHIWRKQNNKWLLSRVISYNHVPDN